jgi:hypothetical protein
MLTDEEDHPGLDRRRARGMIAIRLVFAATTLVVTAFVWVFVIAHVAFTELCSGSKFGAKGGA